MKNNGRKRKHRKEVLAKFEEYQIKYPEGIHEEIVTEGVYYTFARVSVVVNGLPGAIVGEGVSRRSGQIIPDEYNEELGRSIALGRARVACATKLACHKPWVKLRSLLMA